MLHFSFSTVLMASLASIAVAVLIALILSNKDMMVCAGHKILAVFIGLAFVRLLFPFELPFATNVLLPLSFSKAVFYFRQTRTTIMGFRISLWNIFVAIWVVGILFGLYRYIRSYRQAREHIFKYGHDKTSDDRYRMILGMVCEQYRIPCPFRVVELQGLAVPIIFGMKDPCIILPEHMSIPTDKLYYIFQHEILHHLHHSFAVKNIIQIVAIIYWWNPVRLLLCYCSNLLMEMHIDAALTQRDREITEQYASCLLYIKQESLRQAAELPAYFQKDAPSFARAKQDDLLKRTLVLLCRARPWKTLAVNAVLTALIMVISVSSYVFILKAHYSPPHFSETYAEPTEDNAYFILNDDSGYDLYINDKYFETIPALDQYYIGIKIYDKEGVLIDENE